MDNETYTITFGDQAENHVGMQKIGRIANDGFTLDDLKGAMQWFKERNIVCELIDLRTLLHGTDIVCDGEAYILIARKAVDVLLTNYTANDLYREQQSLPKDTKALMKGRVVNKKARYNLCFSDTPQEPNYGAGMGRVVAFNAIPITNMIRTRLLEVIGVKAKDLVAEGNYYYDVNKCFIGYHGDTERRKVIAVRLGATLPLYYQWYHQSQPVGDTLKIDLQHGDVYIMSEKAVGYDWKRRKIPTLRHAAGLEKNIAMKKPSIPIANNASNIADTQSSKTIASMSYRELQQECKRRGLRAVGKTEELRMRLTEGK